MILLLTIMFYAAKTPNVPAVELSVIQITLLMGFEATYGLALGLLLALLFAVIKTSGIIAERQMGFAVAHVIDPLTGQRGQPVGTLMEMIFIIIFLSANGHHLFMLVISQSFDSYALGTMPDITTLATAVTEAGSVMLVAALRLAAPLLTAFLLLMIVLAVLARLAPEMNILFISLPMRVGLGITMAMIFIPFIQGYVSEFTQWMNKLLPL